MTAKTTDSIPIPILYSIFDRRSKEDDEEEF